MSTGIAFERWNFVCAADEMASRRHGTSPCDGDAVAHGHSRQSRNSRPHRAVERGVKSTEMRQVDDLEHGEHRIAVIDPPTTANLKALSINAHSCERAILDRRL